MKVLISGGTGAIGSRLCKMLVNRGHAVTILSRTAKNDSNGFSYSLWNPAKGEIDHTLAESHDAIINLAGAPVTGRWTKRHKEEILSSRIESTRTLMSLLDRRPEEKAQRKEARIQAFIGASAMGYYPNSSELQREDMPSGNHFLATVCREWENASSGAAFYGLRRVIIRIGVVLDTESGMLKTLKPLISSGLLSALGSGRQYVGVIHIEDLCRQFIYALENPDISGCYNGACLEAPQNSLLMHEISRAAGKPFFLPPVPGFVLKLILGEAAEFLLFSFRIRGDSWQKHGFQFLYPTLKDILQDLYK
jgi:uncharacterized protein (TIGR01777 family)